MPRTKKVILPAPVLPLRQNWLFGSESRHPVPMYSVRYAVSDANGHRSDNETQTQWITPDQFHELHALIVEKIKSYAAANGTPLKPEDTGL